VRGLNQRVALLPIGKINSYMSIASALTKVNDINERPLDKKK
jgi:hypothetical protein